MSEKRRALTRQQKLDVWQRQEGLCAICGRPVGLTMGVEWDHRVPLGLTGTNDLDNWQAIHIQCHRDKTTEDVNRIAKAKRMAWKQGTDEKAAAERQRRAAKRPPNAKFQANKTGRYKAKLNGKVEIR